MRPPRFGRPTPSLVVATIALAVALGGTSYAAITVTGKNVKNGTLTSQDVKNRSLLAKDFKVGQLEAGPIGPQGPPGPKGDAGPKGNSGPAGQPGLAAVERVQGAKQAVPDAAAAVELAATCPQGKQAVAGGFHSDPDPAANLWTVLQSERGADARVWRVTVKPATVGGTDPIVGASVVCAKVG